ncbi:MAG: MBOAT family protein, partial [Oscillospiraceae bacterium]|nr:MBOAT family protein [Oscillospiraceae bacterium]
MSFATPLFLIFFAIAAAVCFALPHKWQSAFLLLASLVFYMWALPAYGLLVLATAALGYFAAVLIDRESSKPRRKVLLALSVAFFAAVLLFFKYLDFFAGLFSPGASAGFSLVQPLGISFYTLQLTGYLVDVYRGERPERDFISFALFISFFPQVISGPIARAGELLPQFKKERRFE